MKDLYTDLLEVIEPYLSDFTGYDEEEQAFNIVQAVKELLSEFNIENERLKGLEDEICDFISDISTCGFRYDGRCPDDLDELQCCIEDLCNKFDKYRQTLQEIKAIAEDRTKTYDYLLGQEYTELVDKILDLITKAEEE